jgi:hypothetical protein
MSDKHQLVTGRECSLFDSSHAYHEGYNFYRCTCGEWDTTAKRNEVSNLFLAHVIQNHEPAKEQNANKSRVGKSSR